RRARSQSDRNYVKINTRYGPAGAENLSRGGARAQFFARGGQGAPDAAGRQPGGAAIGTGARGAAVRSLVEEWDAHRGGADAAELRPAAGAARRGNRVGGPRAARSAPRTRTDRRQRSGRAYAAAARRAIPSALSGDRHRRPPRPRAADCRRSAAGEPGL